MIEHIVLIKWTPDALPEQIEEALTALRSLKSQIPGILDLNCGEDISGNAQGYTHALVVRFVDRAALDAYNPHPTHVHVVENFIDAIRDDIAVLDFVIG